MSESKVRVWVTEIGSKGTLVVRWKSADGFEKDQETIGKITGAKRQDAQTRMAAETRALELREWFALPIEQREATEEEQAKGWDQASKEYKTEYLPRNGKSNETIWRIASKGFRAQLVKSSRPLDDVAKLRLKDIEAYRTSLLKDGLAEATAETYINTLRAGFAWFAEREWCDPLPAKRRGTKKKTKMKGRPLTREEVERFCKAVPKKIKTEAFHAGWKHWIEGLYLSGLRLNESLQLTWDDPTGHMVRLGRIPKINFAPTQKNGTAQVIATTPDFATFLSKTPKEQRTGFVFNPMTRAGRVHSETHASKQLSAIGKDAGIHTQPGRTASAHDLRRSFGSRWSLLVMPPVLQHMMRHVSIETTMKYYVDHTADLLGREIKEAFDKNEPPPIITSDRAGEVIADAVAA